MGLTDRNCEQGNKEHRDKVSISETVVTSHLRGRGQSEDKQQYDGTNVDLQDPCSPLARHQTGRVAAEGPGETLK